MAIVFDLLMKVLVGVLTKLVTEQFFSRFVLVVLEAWARQTDNDIDDQIVRVIADALGIEVSLLTKAIKKDEKKANGIPAAAGL